MQNSVFYMVQIKCILAYVFSHPPYLTANSSVFIKVGWNNN